MDHMRENAVFFSYGTRLSELWKLGKFIDGGLAEVNFKTDLNGTRVAAKHILLVSVLRLNKGLKLYSLQNKPTWKLSEEEWETLAEFEGVLRISARRSTAVQSETNFMGAMGRLLHTEMLAEYEHDSLSVLDLSAINATHTMKNLPRIDKPMENLTKLGAECCRRAHLEAERRLCGNKSEWI
jgi:hypothetical protein